MDRILKMFITNDYIKKSEYDLYEYGINVLIMNIIPIIIILFISVIFNQLVYGIAFLLSFIPIRISIGGFHCEKIKNCLLAFSALFLLTLYLQSLKKYLLIQWSGWISILLIWFISPITYDEVDDLNTKLIKTKRNIKVICIIFQFIIVTINSNSFILGIYMACILNVFLYFIGVYDLKKKGEKIIHE